MTERVVAMMLAATAAGCAVAGLGLARPRDLGSSRRRLRIDGRLVWGAVAAILAMLAPGPTFLMVPLAVLLAMRIRRLVETRGEARRRRAMDAEIPQLLDLLAAGSAAGLSAVAGLQRSVSALRGPCLRTLRPRPSRASRRSWLLLARWR